MMNFSPSLSRNQILFAIIAGVCAAATSAHADTLVFNHVVAETYHSPDNRGGSFRIATDGLINTTDNLRQFDTFDAVTGPTTFAGLIQTGISAKPQIFDTVSLSLGFQFVDGGDFETTPNLYLLTQNIDTNTTRPETDAAWALVDGATLSRVGNTYTFTLSGSATARTGYGFAIGGVQGGGGPNANVQFISISELSATGTTTLKPLDAPINVVASSYHSPQTAHEYNRGLTLITATDGRVENAAAGNQANGFDTFVDGGASAPDFAGLIYANKQQFDTVTLSYGNNFADGGRFSTTPRIFLNKTGIDTDIENPDGNPNWIEIVISPFEELDGLTFDLSESLTPEERQGYGWAIGGVVGSGTQGFVSISELSASGTSTLVPEPSAAVLLGMGALGLCLRRARAKRH